MGKISVKRPDHCVACQSCMFACSRRSGGVGLDDSRIVVRSEGGLERGVIIVVCRSCVDPACINSCPSGALTKGKTGGLRLDKRKCIGCKNCMEACSIGAIGWDNITDKPKVCNSCGICAKYCPHDVLELIDGGTNGSK